MKYGLIFLIGITASLLISLPARGQSDEHSQETGVIHDLLKNDQKRWEQILTEQLARREEQLAIEKARQTEIELAKRAEQARLAQIPKSVQKVAQTAVKTATNSYSWGQCVYWAKSKRPDLPTGLGNANTWYSRARAMGFAVGAAPRIGAVATTTRGVRGHVSIVEQIKGNMIYVSEMNVHGVGVLSYAWYPASDYQYIY